MNDRIVIPLDGSLLAEQAIPYALALAPAGAEVILLRVVPKPELATGWLAALSYSPKEVLRQQRRVALDDLQDTAERRATDAARFEIEVAVGDPAAEIVRVATERDAGLIAMASHGRGALGRWTYGAVTDRVARTAPVPVLIVRANDDVDHPSAGEVRRLLVPLDGSALAARALPVAGELAQRLDIPIDLVTVLDPAAMVSPTAAYAATASSEIYDELIAGMQGEAKRMLEQVASALRAQGIATAWEIHDGAIAPAVMLAARPGDLIVLSSHGRSGLTRWLLGSVAEKLVRLAPVPVLLVPTRSPESAAASPFAPAIAAATTSVRPAEQ